MTILFSHPPSAAPALKPFRRPDYIPTDVGRTSVRPGAYAAFDLPSRQGDSLTFSSGFVAASPIEPKMSQYEAYHAQFLAAEGGAA